MLFSELNETKSYEPVLDGSHDISLNDFNVVHIMAYRFLCVLCRAVFCVTRCEEGCNVMFGFDQTQSHFCARLFQNLKGGADGGVVFSFLLCSQLIAHVPVISVESENMD